MKELRFGEWVNYLFNREVTDEHWYLSEANPLVLPLQTFVEYGARLLAESGSILLKYSDQQVNQGLYRIASNVFSEEVQALRNPHVDMSLRLDFVAGIFSLYRDCFNIRCTPHLSHLDKSTPPYVSPLNSICYMWWDVFILFGDREESLEMLNQCCLKVMEKSLALPNIAVKEGALHGLGHFESDYPKECHQIVAEFVSSECNLPPELLAYAESAKEGKVQ